MRTPPAVRSTADRPQTWQAPRALRRASQRPAAALEAALRHLTRLAVDEGRSLDEVFMESTKLSARVLDVERVGIWLLEDGCTQLRCVRQYRSSVSTYGSGEVLHPSDFPAYGNALAAHRAIVADDARTHPRTRELARDYLEPNGITSMLDAPVLRRGKVAGVVCHEHVGPKRTWTDAERSFAASVADIVALAMEQAACIEARRTWGELRRLLEEERPMAALGRVVAGVAHDFGHLLSIILARVQCIRDVPGLDERAVSHARAVVDAIRRSRELTRQLVELGRGREDRLAVPLRLDDVVGANADLLRALPQRGQRIEIELGADGARVGLDRLRLEQMLMNLVGNALDATTDGCTVGVRTTKVVRDGVEYAVLQVADDGVGIDETTRPHIFEPYFTTKHDTGGCGLGLALVHATVERVGGFVTLESAAGRGTTLAVHLPITSDGARVLSRSTSLAHQNGNALS
jgi:signal transduction histidine kinase